MRNLSVLAPRQVLLLWLCGLGLVPVLIGSGIALNLWMNQPQITAARRRGVLVASRNLTADSAYRARIKADTADQSFRAAWKRGRDPRFLQALTDSALLAQVAKNPQDTAYSPAEDSVGAIGWMLAGGLVAGICLAVAFGIPFALIGFTAWWSYKRWCASRVAFTAAE